MKTEIVLINHIDLIQQVEQKIQLEHKVSLEKAQREIESMFKNIQTKDILCEANA